MNKKAKIGETLLENIVFLVFLGFVLLLTLGFIFQQKEGAAVREQFYVSGIVNAINLAGNGTEVKFDMYSAKKVAVNHRLANLEEMVTIDNDKKEVCVKLTPSRKTCRKYTNDIYIDHWRINVLPGSHDLSFRVLRGEA